MQLPLDVIAERVKQEIEVKDQQGYYVDGLLASWEQIRSNREELLKLHQNMQFLSYRKGWQYDEPCNLEGIRDASQGSIDLPDFYLSEVEIKNKIHGGWLGRTAGCILGKPLEMGFSMDEIRLYLEGADAYPLQDYVPAQSSHSSRPLRRDCVPSMKGYVQYAQEDDDLNYMCLAVKLLENYGFDFTSQDVGINWLQSMPFLWTWGPEHVVYLNLATAIGEHEPKDIDLDAVTAYLNPGTEWIGAQIRTDVYGYVCPGDPRKASEYAWRDAYLTHRMSGIYGAMWVAAMNAVAFTLLDMESIINAGLAQVPKNSRFREAILQTIEQCKKDKGWWKTGAWIEENFNYYGFAGTINNACCVAAALMYGWGEGSSAPSDRYERTITTAGQLGYDTDCNGATAGSVAGIVLGAHALPEKWISPLNDTMKTCVVEFGQVKISEMATRTHQLSRINRALLANR